MWYMVIGDINLCGICCITIGKIVEEWMPVDLDLEMYRINYKPSDCDHPKIVVDRARSRTGECQ